MKVKEILVLHHSHLDLGYTHPQPILRHLQYDFIDEALRLLSNTVHWPEVSRPKWTCEVTFQVSEWLHYADNEQLTAFKKYAAEGRIGFGGFEFNTTPLCNYEQLVHQLSFVKEARKQFGVEIKAAIQHDVNGIPWSAGDLLLDIGIDTLIMGINSHQGGAPLHRPLIFRWQTPSGREILVMNGEHYTMFDQLFNTSSGNIDDMGKGIQKYLDRLDKQGYPHDFIYLTSTNIPVCWDNGPPNAEVANLIKLWNNSGRTPVIRYVIPDELSTRIHTLENLQLYKGDWTDYWNFGCGSSAYETALNRGTKARLFLADFLDAVNGFNHSASADAREKAWKQIDIFDEHTWGNDESMDFDHPETRSQWALKASAAYEGRALSEYALIRELELFSGNPEQSKDLEGVLLINPYPELRTMTFHVPEKWKIGGKKLGTARFRYDEQLYNTVPKEAPLYSLEIEGYSWAKIPFGKLKKYSAPDLCTSGEECVESITDMNGYDEIVNKEKKSFFIQSPYYRLVFDPLTGRILNLHDRIQNREIIDTKSDYGFFQLIREFPDPQFDGSRTAYFERDLSKMLINESCWKVDWKARIETPGELLSFNVVKTERAISLIRHYKIFGVSGMKQTITLPVDRKVMELEVSFEKKDIREPEALYFAFPLNLEKGWNGTFDTAGMSVELDKEQLSGTCKDWVTVESYASMNDSNFSVLLNTPDAPMVMFGDFNYGRKNETIQRNRKPLLISWPINNYWQTNFRVSQPGKIEFNYTFQTGKDFSVLHNRIACRDLPLIVHPLVNCKQMEEGCFLQIEGEDVELLHMKRVDNGEGYIIRLANHSLEESSISLTIPGKKILKANECSPFGEPGNSLLLQNDLIVYKMAGRKISTIQIYMRKNDDK